MLSKFKKYVPVIINALTLNLGSVLMLLFKPKWLQWYIPIIIIIELVFFIFLVYLMPTYSRVFPKLFGDVKVKPSSALRNVIIDAVAVSLPAIVNYLINLL